MLRANGYSTACVGKWHVGLTFFDKDGQPVRGNGVEAVRRVDFSRRIEGGPVDHGFCHSIYFLDPNGIRLELTWDLRGFTETDAAEAARAVEAWTERTGRVASSAR